MHKTESIIENAVHNILWGFEMQTDPSIPVRKTELVLIDKKKKEPVIWLIFLL